MAQQMLSFKRKTKPNSPSQYDVKNAIQHAVKNERGMATIETIPLIMVFVFMLCYEFGIFGIIHTGIMHSISARAYAFETFRNRSSLVYFRDGVNDQKPLGVNYFRNSGTRTHGIRSEKVTDNDAQVDGIASERPIRVGIPFAPDLASRKDLERHNTKLFDQTLVGPQKRNTSVEVNPVWIQVQYGICLNAHCGG
jgi:hypothetical protein